CKTSRYRRRVAFIARLYVRANCLLHACGLSRLAHFFSPLAICVTFCLHRLCLLRARSERPRCRHAAPLSVMNFRRLTRALVHKDDTRVSNDRQQSARGMLHRNRPTTATAAQGHLLPCRQGLQRCPPTAALPQGTDAQHTHLPTVKECHDGEP